MLQPPGPGLGPVQDSTIGSQQIQTVRQRSAGSVLGVRHLIEQRGDRKAEVKHARLGHPFSIAFFCP